MKFMGLFKDGVKEVDADGYVQAHEMLSENEGEFKLYREDDPVPEFPKRRRRKKKVVDEIPEPEILPEKLTEGENDEIYT